MSEPENKKQRSMVGSKPKFKDLGAMDDVVRELKLEVMTHLINPGLHQRFGLTAMRSVLLQGPVGCGKSTLARAIANEAEVSLYEISATELFPGGASSKDIKTLLSESHKSPPFVLFIDDIASREVEHQILQRLSTWMAHPDQPDPTSEKPYRGPGFVLLIGATTAVDPRPGSFDLRFTLGVPGEAARAQILLALTRDLKLDADFDPVTISRSTPRFVGADLAKLVRAAGHLSFRRASAGAIEDFKKDLLPPQDSDKLCITMADFEEAAKKVQPYSSIIGGFSTVPDVKWEDVVGLDSLKRMLQHYILRPIKRPEEHKDSGVGSRTGILLYGPPGCGKTLIASAVANDAGVHFIHVKCPDLVGSQSALQDIFSRARAYAPCILFFDEVDAVTSARGKEEKGRGQLGEQLLLQVDARGKEEEGWGRHGKQLLFQLRSEMENAHEHHPGIHIVGATNRPDLIDPEILRPERFGHHFHVPLPNQQERRLILEALFKEKLLHADVDVDLTAISLNKACSDFSGGDLSRLINAAAKMALDEEISNLERESYPHDKPPTIKAEHFVQALETISSEKKKENLFLDYVGVCESFKKH